MSKLSSIEEKRKSFAETGDIEHWMFVEELINLLKELQPNDWIQVNKVGNLMVFREDFGQIGYISMCNNEIELFSKGDG